MKCLASFHDEHACLDSLNLEGPRSCKPTGTQPNTWLVVQVVVHAGKLTACAWWVSSSPLIFQFSVHAWLTKLGGSLTALLCENTYSEDKIVQWKCWVKIDPLHFWIILMPIGEWLSEYFVIFEIYLRSLEYWRIFNSCPMGNYFSEDIKYTRVYTCLYIPCAVQYRCCNECIVEVLITDQYCVSAESVSSQHWRAGVTGERQGPEYTLSSTTT